MFQKDFLDLRKNRGLLWSMLALPAVIVVVPIGVVLAYVRNPEDPNLRVMAQYYGLSAAGENAVEFSGRQGVDRLVQHLSGDAGLRADYSHLVARHCG